MPVLHNRISNEELKARMLAETEPRTTVSFYKYFTLEDAKPSVITSIANLLSSVFLAASMWQKRVSMHRSASPRIDMMNLKSRCLPHTLRWIKYG